MQRLGQMPTLELQEEMKSFGEKSKPMQLWRSSSRSKEQLSVCLSDIERIVFEPIQIWWNKADSLFSIYLFESTGFCFKDLLFDAFWV